LIETPELLLHREKRFGVLDRGGDFQAIADDAGIVRNRLKIEAAIENAKMFLAVQEEFGTFDAYIWQFVGGKPIRNRWNAMSQVPARTRESDALSADLRRRGFTFVGSTICYAFMQAVGMVNDHLRDCWRAPRAPGSRRRGSSATLRAK